MNKTLYKFASYLREIIYQHMHMIRIFTLMAIMSAFIQNALAQTPQHYPEPEPEPVEINLFNILVYIGIPVLIILLYILTRRRSSKRKS